MVQQLEVDPEAIVMSAANDNYKHCVFEPLEWDAAHSNHGASALGMIEGWALAGLQDGSLRAEHCAMLTYGFDKPHNKSPSLHWHMALHVMPAAWPALLRNAMTHADAKLVILRPLPSQIRDHFVPMSDPPRTIDALSYVSWFIPKSLQDQVLERLGPNDEGFLVGHDGQYVLVVKFPGRMTSTA